MPLRLHTLAHVLNPQPEPARVLHGVLAWIATQRGAPRPAPHGRPRELRVAHATLLQTGELS